MITRILIVLTYIAACIRLRAKPWQYFQLNAAYFNQAKGIFSKLDIDQLIPSRWRLNQFRDSGNEQPQNYPVFIKPEWGQNSAGIVRADNFEQLQQHRAERGEGGMPFLVQEGAHEANEYEVYVIRSEEDDQQFALMSVTQTANCGDEKYPINGIYNQQTRYIDLSSQIDSKMQQAIWSQLKQIRNFRVARFGLRADSIEAISKGQFHIIEINLFLPFPLYLQSEGTDWKARLSFLLRNTYLLARVTRTIPKNQKHKSVFFRKLYVHRTTRVDRQKGIAL